MTSSLVGSEMCIRDRLYNQKIKATSGVRGALQLLCRRTGNSLISGVRLVRSCTTKGDPASWPVGGQARNCRMR
eukprot:4654736-Prorocentrum_lima.AAC.1